ncbi:prenyltransferase/squalene oxidase repeat-containing protein [Agrococcus carbonis]|uniref:Prenyltransferase and squalene oxidase repeat-containing protein n=1 Tax=Agrococcus carbonis TaxID=684552 RepID=A0A1H1LEV1_9MICO|nr:hypothetical protein [Agrococcus carbonis]SDR73058.1 hypothetical protein SAMN04489719_0569 [Agrococcus carbonis]
MSVVDWLLEGDPAIRWQVLADLLDEDPDAVARERARVATEGWGAALLAARGPDGQWAGGAHFPKEPPTLPGQPWTSTAHVLTELRLLGVDPHAPAVREAIADVARVTHWEYDGEPFFEGEVEPCINGALVTNAVYYGEADPGLLDDRIVERLLGERMADGGWNCEQEHGSVRSSFDTTIAVLEALAAVERVRDDERIRAARASGEAYLLERDLLRRRSTGEIPKPTYTRFAFPPRHEYDALRALEHFRAVGAMPDERMQEALDLVHAKRLPDGTWPLDVVHGGDAVNDYGKVGEPNRWITLKALRVLRWAEG